MKLPRALQDIGTVEKLLTGAEDQAHLAGDSPARCRAPVGVSSQASRRHGRRAFERVRADPELLRGAIATAHAQALHSIGILARDDMSAVPAAGPDAPAAGVFHANAFLDQAFQAAVKLSKAAKPARLLGACRRGRVPDGARHSSAGPAIIGVDRAELAAAATTNCAPRPGDERTTVSRPPCS